MNPPSKIVLGTTSKVSLNDRFTKLAKTKPAAAEVRSIQNRASARNRSLALSMANKPSVQAALRGKPVRPLKRASLNQRLGTGNRIDSSRLNIGRKGGPKQQGPPERKLPIQQRLSVKQVPLVGKGKVSRVGPRGGIGLKNRVKFLKQKNANIKQKMQKPGVKAALVKKGLNGKPKSAIKGKVQKEAPKNKESLDMDLDKYMSKTKHSLDNDLDTYMAQAN